MSHRRVVPLLALAAVGVACTGACTDPAKPDAERLISAVDRFRLGARGDHGAYAKAVVAVTSPDAEVARAKDTCAAAVTLIDRGEESGERVKAELARGQPPAARRVALSTELDDAEKQLRDGYARLPQCDTALNALKKRFGIRG